VSELNQRLFDGTDLRPAVKATLMRVAEKFIQFLNDPTMHVSDIILTGSNASYNFTPQSDVDLHILCDFADLPFASIAASYFLAEKAVFKQTYDIRVCGYPVETYVQDTGTHDQLRANGIFSILQDKWLKFPDPLPAIDQNAIDHKAADFGHQVDTLLAGNPTVEEIDEIGRKIRGLRSAGLETPAGEFSVENLTFKALRNEGYFDRLNAEKKRLQSAELSLESMSSRVIRLAERWQGKGG